jgi:DNA invertase Pin-like site-specific DNA recombinase
MSGVPAVPGRLSMPEKVQRSHRDRLAIVYIRQSTMQQLERNQESTRLQYALVERAVQFGWPRERIVVIDDDLGCSGSSAEGRLGFQRLVAEVGLDHVGLVLGIEMSRLARSCRDWHQLLEICALFDTLIADVDGVYDPASYNDRLLLGLKGTMSEAELHIIKARMEAGRRAKAQRGELGKAVPMGYVRLPSGEVALDPDAQAQDTIRLIFDLFDRFRTVNKVLTYLVEHDIRMPVRVRGGPGKGELAWHRPNRPSLHNLFANPIYAGVYAYGIRQVDRRRQRAGRPGTGRGRNAPEEAEVFLKDRMPAYISWERYQRNRAQIARNRADCVGPVRAGQALLSGLLVCGHCGLRMMAQYNSNGSGLRYVCCRMMVDYGEPVCQSLMGWPLDNLVAELVLQALEPAALEASLAVAGNLEAERAELDRHWHQRLERARYASERTRRQYDAVDPDNRLVASTLERAWEETLAEEAKLAEAYDAFQREQPSSPDAAELDALRHLASDIPALWHADTTTQADRQTIVRTLLERVLVKVIDGSERVDVQCHWHGGHRTGHTLIRPVAKLTDLSTYSQLVERASELHQTGASYARIADILNEEGWRPAKRRSTFNAQMVHHLLSKAGVITPRSRRKPPEFPREADEWTVRELAGEIGMPEPTLYTWIQQGRLRSRRVAVGVRNALLIHADAETIAELKAIRAMPAPWRRRPPLLNDNSSPTIES